MKLSLKLLFTLVALNAISLIGCDSPETDLDLIALTAPEVEFEGNPFDPYALSDVYFNDSTDLNFKVRAIYYANGGDIIPEEALKKRVKIMSDAFEESSAHILFSLKSYEVIEGRPDQDPNSLAAIKQYEILQTMQQRTVRGEKAVPVVRNDLRSYFILDQMKFWHKTFGQVGYINIHIVNDTLTDMVAYAADIGAIDVFMRVDALNPDYYTLEHEIGHALGLYHTHEIDSSRTGLTPFTGDLVGDTPKTAPLHVYMNPNEGNCTMRQNWKDLHRATYNSRRNRLNDVDFIAGDQAMLEVIKRNIMSYVSKWCREDFTPRQVKRMRKVIEGSKDLREAIEEFDRFRYVSEYSGLDVIDLDSLKASKNPNAIGLKLALEKSMSSFSKKDKERIHTFIVKHPYLLNFHSESERGLNPKAMHLLDSIQYLNDDKKYTLAQHRRHHIVYDSLLMTLRVHVE